MSMVKLILVELYAQEQSPDYTLDRRPCETWSHVKCCEKENVPLASNKTQTSSTVTILIKLSQLPLID
jgi:hypothetical protein